MPVKVPYPAYLNWLPSREGGAQLGILALGSSTKRVTPDGDLEVVETTIEAMPGGTRYPYYACTFGKLSRVVWRIEDFFRKMRNKLELLSPEFTAWDTQAYLPKT